MKQAKIKGLVPATYTPMKGSGSINTNVVPDMVNRLINQGVKGIFVCGSTGEGPSLTTPERKVLSEAFVEAVAKRIPVFVHVGHNSIAEAKELAVHAQKIGADFISAVAPSYFKVDSVSTLVETMAEIASGAPELPFYYYNIPALTGMSLDMLQFLEQAEQSIPNLAGIKYTTSMIHEYQACMNWQNNKYELLYGTDEMLLSALSVGAKGFIGSTYNLAAPLYQKIIVCFESGEIDQARKLQLKAIEMIKIIVKYGVFGAQKAAMKLLGIDCGTMRLPLKPIRPGELASLEKDLDAIGFFGELFQGKTVG